MDLQSFIIATSEVGTRIETLCAKKFPDFSRSAWAKGGKFFYRDVEKPGKTKVKEGEHWKVQFPVAEVGSSKIIPWDFPLKILKNSKTWVAIEKPDNISVHGSVSERGNKTIVNALAHQFGKNLSAGQEDVGQKECMRPGIVHRLDKGTSGILLVAKTNKTHRYLQEHWKEVEKTYHAVVVGTPPEKGKIEAGILRNAGDRTKMTVSSSEKARDAVTYFEVLESKNGLSLLKIKIPTGRTHQIRVHLSAIGFPVFGDEKYGGGEGERMMLHASELRFPDPDCGGEKMEVLCGVQEGFGVCLGSAGY